MASEPKPGDLRVVESFDIGDDWPWRFSVERYEGPGRFLWFRYEARWRPIKRGVKLSTAQSILANGGKLERVHGK